MATQVGIPINLLAYKPQQQTTALCWQINPESIVDLKSLEFIVEVDVVNTFDSINKKVYTKDNVVNFQNGTFFKAFVIDDPLLFEEQNYYWRVKIDCEDYESFWSDTQKKETNTFIKDLEYGVPVRIQHVGEDDSELAIEKVYATMYVLNGIVYTEDDFIEKVNTDYGITIFLGDLQYDIDKRISVGEDEEIVVRKIHQARYNVLSDGEIQENQITEQELITLLDTDYVYEYVGPQEYNIKNITWYEDTETAENLLPDNYVYTKIGNTNIKRIIEMYMRLIGVFKNEAIQVANNYNYKKIQDKDLYDMLGVLLSYTRNTEEPFVTYKYELYNLWQAYLHQGTIDAINIILEALYGVVPTIQILKNSVEDVWAVYEQMQLLNIDGSTPTSSNYGEAYYSPTLDQIVINGATNGVWDNLTYQKPNEQTTYQLMEMVGSSNIGLTNLHYENGNFVAGKPDVERYFVRYIEEQDDIFYPNARPNPFLYTNQYLAHNLLITVNNVYGINIDKNIVIDILNMLKPLNTNILLDIKGTFIECDLEFTIIDAANNTDITSTTPIIYKVDGTVISVEDNKISVVKGSNITYKVVKNGYETYIGTIENVTTNQNITIKIEQIFNGLKLTSTDNTTIKYINVGSSNPDMKYRTKGNAWTTWNANTGVDLADGEYIYIKGNNASGVSQGYNDYTSFNITGTGTLSASGNAYSLLDDGDGSTITSLSSTSFAFSFLFFNCAKLTTAPELSATTLGVQCYWRMFEGCVLLEETPELPATTLANNCYYNMFSGCSNLTKVSTLPATIMTERCYGGMFRGCSSLTKSPALPATTLAQYCYAEMFDGCSSLEAMPNLSCTTLASSCYFYMFKDCISLTKTTDLTATTMMTGCYDAMFQGCTSLEVSPNIYATTLAGNCFQNMFSGCSSLNTITLVKYMGNFNSSFSNWVYNVAPSGDIYYNGEDTTESASAIPIGWTIQNTEFKGLKFKAVEANAKISYTLNTISPDIKYSYDGETWYTWNAGDEIPLTNIGDFIYVKGNNPHGIGRGDRTTNNGYMQFITGENENSPKIAASGNINSLLDNGDGSYITAIPGDLDSGYSWCYYSLFKNCKNLTKAPNLPAIDVYTHAYRDMFMLCISLTTAPELPATILASYCYYNMFYGCMSLTSAPELPAEEMYPYCYSHMFHNCQNLATAPELPAMTLAEFCYQAMFYRCYALTTSPELPAMDLKSNCYESMYGYCTSLVNVPDLPAELSQGSANVYYCYSSMFDGCSSLVKAPDIYLKKVVTGAGIWSVMFQNCTKLKSIKLVNYTGQITAAFGFQNWVNGVGTGGTIYYKGSTTTQGVSSIPVGWAIDQNW